jgi:ABC-type transport system involved in multi-copper enzyme maturation permease subunit
MTVFAVARDHVTDLRHRRVILVLLVAAVLLALGFCGYLVVFDKIMAAGMAAHGRSPKAMTEAERAQFEQMMQMGRPAMQTGLYGLVSLMGSLLSLVMFCSLVSSEQARGSLTWVLSKPVTREQFLLGKWLGACFILVVYTVVISAILLGYSWFVEGSLSPTLGYTCVLMLFKFLLMGSVGMALAMVMPPGLGGVLAYFAGAETFQWIAMWFIKSHWLRGILTALYYVFPSYSKFNAYTQFFLGIEIGPIRALQLAGYALTYSILMMGLAIVALRRRELV